MSSNEIMQRVLMEVLVIKSMVQSNHNAGNTKTFDTDKEVLNVEECAQLTGLKKSTLYRLTHERRVPFFKPGGNRVYFNRADILKWLQSNRIDSDAEIERSASQHIVHRIKR